MKKMEHGGICSTCEGRATCTYPIPKDRPVLFCEEFEGLCDNLTAAAGTGQFMWGGGGRVSVEMPRHRVEVRRKQSPYKGLCATCESQAACTFPKSAGGVWHCEEFV